MDDLLELVRQRTVENNFMHYNHIRVERVEPDQAACVLDAENNSLNNYGVIHGGALYTLADNAAGVAIHTDGRQYVTLEGTLHFLSNVGGGAVRAEASVRHRGRSTALADVILAAESGKVLATGEFTYFCVDAEQFRRRAAETAQGKSERIGEK